jgi:hypothetical protein
MPLAVLWGQTCRNPTSSRPPRFHYSFEKIKDKSTKYKKKKIFQTLKRPLLYIMVADEELPCSADFSQLVSQG